MGWRTFWRSGAVAYAVCAGLGAASTAYRDVPEYQAIERDFTVTSVAQGDIDGDALDEVAVAYRTRTGGAPEGGLLVLRPVGGALRPAYHGFFEGTYASRLEVVQGGLRLVLVRAGVTGDARYLLEWRYGRDFVFRDDARAPGARLRAKASSSLRGGVAPPDDAVDNDLTTAWGEGVRGTGVGETLTVQLGRPTDLALVGIFPGRSPDRRAFVRNNRLHRATLEFQTEADVGDSAAELDFQDLGIDIGGDTLEVTFRNEPAFVFFPVRRERVVNLVVHIDSVFLGERDDTYVAEVEPVELVRRARTLDRAKPIAPEKKKKPKPQVSGRLIEE